MGGIASCNCNKGTDNEELNLEKPKDEKNLPKAYTFKENGISPILPISPIPGGELESTQKQAKKAHQKTLSNEYIVEIESDK
jgi:hypothetical protein